ncbi:MAG TPA: MarC family protein [Nitrososphaerales archaeon]|nr:MarC family protein [Nitrososphaerales archaeon]
MASSFLSFDLALFVSSFALLFAIFDPIGSVPIYMAVTKPFPQERARIVRQSVLVATVILYVFAYLGWVIFDLLGITLDDFRVAGGIVLFMVALEHLSGRVKPENEEASEVAVFPLATPLLAGPGAISTVVILANPPYGPLMTFVVITGNALVAYAILAKSDWVQRILGENGSRALSRITALLIAALAVSFVREGIVNIIGSMK